MAFKEEKNQYLQFDKYRLTAEQGKCLSCYRAVPIFAAKNPFLENVKYIANTQHNILEKICLDCVIHHMERIRVLPRYHAFEIAAKKNNDIENESLNCNIENLDQFNLRDSCGSNSSTGVCDFKIKEIHEFCEEVNQDVNKDDELYDNEIYNDEIYNDEIYEENEENEENVSSRIIRVTERFKFNDGCSPGAINSCDYHNINNATNEHNPTDLFKNLKKHVNHPNYLYTPNDLNELTNPVPFTLSAGLLMSKKVKIEDNIKLIPDPDFVFENYKHHSDV